MRKEIRIDSYNPYSLDASGLYLSFFILYTLFTNTYYYYSFFLILIIIIIVYSSSSSSTYSFFLSVGPCISGCALLVSQSAAASRKNSFVSILHFVPHRCHTAQTIYVYNIYTNYIWLTFIFKIYSIYVYIYYLRSKTHL